ncbi:MAG: CCA tRNA nucleotidyltransferase [Rhodobacteraceae bacterium]|nr:CCA tRNA nucleotidyltransferase [Paracoccaceae bacterium]MCY4196067.1 CCA tRNA nucleotidyltransferase [Paracoccaceae bacterium]MCY4328233.1 CCA tRNA nucleotidyltransferase [Paracoccaceae bacterium]
MIRRQNGNTVARRLGRLYAAWPDAVQVSHWLRDLGHDVYFVGGAVRDTLCEMQASDVDLATDAAPEQIHAVADINGIKTSSFHSHLGAITLYFDNAPVTVTSLKRDHYVGDTLTVELTRSLHEDAARRDLTINAIYADIDGHIEDPVQGFEDLNRGIVRFIGCPHQRIGEDPLRILRYFRIRTGFCLWNRQTDDEILDAMRHRADRISDVSRERIGAEMQKLLNLPIIFPALVDMQTCGLLPHCLPGADISCIRRLEIYERQVAAEPDWHRRMVVLGVTDPKANLRLRKSSARRLRRIGRWAAGAASLAELTGILGSQDALSVVLVRAAVSGEAPPDMTGGAG